MAAQSNDTGSSSGLKKFFKQNKTLVFLLPVLLILIIVVVIIYIPKGAKQPDSGVQTMAENTLTKSNKVDVLPQTERVTDEEAADKADSTVAEKDENVVKDPFEGPLTYNGVLINNNGDNIAIIEGNGKSYLVRQGDVIGDSLKVDSISADEVVLKDNDRTTVLKLEQRKSSQTANK